MKKILLTRGLSALVDDEWFDYLNQWKWCVFKSQHGKFYAARLSSRKEGKQKVILMHRMVMFNPEARFQIDHIDGDGLNNQIGNLRIASQSQNQMNRGITRRNTSGYKGVSWHKNNQKWRVQIQVNHVKKTVGYFLDVEEAARAYDAYAIQLHGKFAHLNFPITPTWI